MVVALSKDPASAWLGCGSGVVAALLSGPKTGHPALDQAPWLRCYFVGSFHHAGWRRVFLTKDILLLGRGREVETILLRDAAVRREEDAVLVEVPGAGVLTLRCDCIAEAERWASELSDAAQLAERLQLRSVTEALAAAQRLHDERAAQLEARVVTTLQTAVARSRRIAELEKDVARSRDQELRIKDLERQVERSTQVAKLQAERVRQLELAASASAALAQDTREADAELEAVASDLRGKLADAEAALQEAASRQQQLDDAHQLELQTLRTDCDAAVQEKQVLYDQLDETRKREAQAEGEARTLRALLDAAENDATQRRSLQDAHDQEIKDAKEQQESAEAARDAALRQVVELKERLEAAEQKAQATSPEQRVATPEEKSKHRAEERQAKIETSAEKTAVKERTRKSLAQSSESESLKQQQPQQAPQAVLEKRRKQAEQDASARRHREALQAMKSEFEERVKAAERMLERSSRDLPGSLMSSVAAANSRRFSPGRILAAGSAVAGAGTSSNAASGRTSPRGRTSPGRTAAAATGGRASPQPQMSPSRRLRAPALQSGSRNASPIVGRISTPLASARQHASSSTKQLGAGSGSTPTALGGSMRLPVAHAVHAPAATPVGGSFHVAPGTLRSRSGTPATPATPAAPGVQVSGINVTPAQQKSVGPHPVLVSAASASTIALSAPASPMISSRRLSSASSLQRLPTASGVS
eukprot:TRINITY_DN5431_c0_g1_i2.p1 TRINITY_DN5431_c0_g1~~TRINITY_DN5431_c0_g1_i2.p1  ORF type:complete len:707 (-),score=180.28 TRINITY_DN5431_c0_g1_i2:138-2258(-)